MPTSAFHHIKPSIFYVEERGPNAKDPAGSLIMGTAFVLDAQRGLLATAAHVVEGAVVRDLRVRSVYSVGGSYALGVLAPVTAAYLHPDHDLAILEVADRHTRGRPTLPPGNADVGRFVAVPGFALGTDLVWVDEILGVGSPKSISPVQSHGHIAARIPDDGVQPLLVCAYDCTTYPGQSGSPVVDVETKTLLAVHTHGRPGMGYGISVRLLFEFLSCIIDADDPPQKVADSVDPLDLPCASEPAPHTKNPEKDVKLGGRNWRVHRQDPDPKPSDPHAHLLGTRYKLHLGSGDLYQRGEVVSKISKSELVKLRQAVDSAGITPPELVV